MSDTNSWGDIPIVSAAISAASAAMAFFVGLWAQRRSEAQKEGARDTEIDALKHEIGRLQRLYDDLQNRVGMVGERMAQMPTREEMAASFARLEGRLDALVFRREG